MEKMGVIGTWDMPTTPTIAFMKNMATIMPKSMSHLADPSKRRVSKEQMSVLNFLADHLIEGIYDTVVKALQSMPEMSDEQTHVVRKLLETNGVAKDNRDKFKQQTLLPGGFHWFKALVLIRLEPQAKVKYPYEPEIFMDLRLVVFFPFACGFNRIKTKALNQWKPPGSNVCCLNFSRLSFATCGRK